MDPFTSVPTYETVLAQEQQQQAYAFVQGGQSLSGLNTISVGSGDQVMRMDQNGLFLGASTFANAPFSVDMGGNVIANSIKIISAVDISSSDNLNQQFSLNGTPVLVTGSTASIDFQKSTIIIFIGRWAGYMNVPKGASEVGGTGEIRTYIDGAYNSGSHTFIGGRALGGTDLTGITDITSIPIYYLTTVTPGTHSFSLYGQVNTSNGAKFTLYTYYYSIISLGNT